jgi:protein-tyrosine phosphatase
MPIYNYEDNYNEILPNLFLGNYLASQNKSFIKNQNIGGIINVTIKEPNFFSGINYLRISVENKKKYIKTFEKKLNKIVPFVDKHLKKGKGVLIHCKSGHRRSVCVLAYYMMKKYNLKRKDVLQYIRNIRPTIFNPRWTVHFYNSINLQ